MAFNQFTERMVTVGIGRIAKNATVLSSDPVNMADFMNASFVWSSTDGWTDLGATVGGVSMTHGLTKSAVRVDQADSDIKSRVKDNTYTISTQLAEVGNLDTFEEAWLAADATTTVSTTLEAIKGLAAVRTVPRKSLAVSTVDEANKLRVYYFRDVEIEGGDSTLNLNESDVQVLPVTWKAHPSTAAAAGKEFGFMMDEQLYGGVTHS